MSKQYLTTHAIDAAHPTDIFSLAVTPNSIISASGASSLQINSTTTSSFPHLQTLGPAHKLGCHHICTSTGGHRAVSVGFGGEVRVWARVQKSDNNREKDDVAEEWIADGEVKDNVKAGELWAPALSHEGRYLAATTHDGRVNVWDVESEDGTRPKIRCYETKGSFGLCCDMSHDSSLTATGHANGSVYVFVNSTGKLQHSLPSLHSHVRSVRFSPASTLLAAAGDSRVIALFDTKSGEQLASLSGHQSWIMCLDWSSTGEYLASGSWDGSVRVWSIERRECVAFLRDAAGNGGPTAGKCIWALKWLPRVEGRRGEGFAVAGAGRSISFYREAAGS